MELYKQPVVYILASQRNGTLYTGVTSNLGRRISQHQNNDCRGFTRKYSVHRLVHFERYQDMYSAIAREKQIKKWSRKRKIQLIRKLNPKWNDLSEEHWFIFY